MGRSLRDELLRAGLVTRERTSRAGRGARSSSGPPGPRAAKKPAKRRTREASRRHLPDPAPAASAASDEEARLKQLNLGIRRILDTEAEKVDAETDVPFHFTRDDRIKRLYVSEDQRRRLSDGELAIVGFRGRHHLVPRRAGERIRELRPEVFVFVVTGGSDADATEGYEGYEVPDGLVW